MTINLKEREYRSFSDFEAVDSSDDGLWIEGYAAVFDSTTVLYSFGGIDYKEKIDRKAFSTTDLTDVILNYDHSGKVIARTRNKTLQISVDNKGLFVRARLDGTEEGRRIHEEIKGGYLDKMSFAFSVPDQGDEYDTATHTRTIKNIKRLFDVSVVSIPAYNQTTVSVRNQFQVIADQETLAAKRKKLILQTLL